MFLSILRRVPNHSDQAIKGFVSHWGDRYNDIPSASNVLFNKEPFQVASSKTENPRAGRPEQFQAVPYNSEQFRADDHNLSYGITHNLKGLCPQRLVFITSANME